MAMANPPPGALAVDNRHGHDPFVTSAQDSQRQRYSAFDHSHFSLYLNGSPIQAKRALQAHLAETTRRLQETSHLGNALVQQRKELEDRLKEVDQQQQENDIGPELRQRLAELEKEFNEVGRETARTFLPKSRVPSGETDNTAGDSVYSSQAQHSPTKVNVPSRKQRNQQPSRINDIALATEISTSLLSQLKDLQAVLLQKDDALKAADLDRSQLEIEVEGLSQRLRTLDESESRLKDVNWGLETQVRDSEAQSKSAADKEQRLNNALNLARAEKSTIEREFEELKQTHSKLNDDHINKTKQHETELSSLRRNVAMGDSERSALQRKVEEVMAQNQELARAMAYRMNGEDYAHVEDTSQDESKDDGDTNTPEHSPPPSPNKATPRHGMLESETLKHSLQHAHRMIQQLKNNIHREKSEKIELKRMLQDARDEIDTNRSLNAPGSANKRKKHDKDVFKKPARPDRLGALRSGTQEVVMVDEDWEEHDGSPSRASKVLRDASDTEGSGFTSAAEGFETANDTSDAFETANERDEAATESDAFQTGVETLDGNSSDELTETETGPSRSVTRQSRPKLPEDNRYSFQSTASASGDEFDRRTPNHPRFTTKLGGARMSTPRGVLDFIANTTPVAIGSPASFVSSKNGTPAQKKSLFAELEDLSGDDDGSYVEDTPSKSSVLHSRDTSPLATHSTMLGRSPLLVSALPKPTMVDSSTMTEMVALQPVCLSSIWAQDTLPQAIRPTTLGLSSFSFHDTSPKTVVSPTFDISTVSGHHTSPQLPQIAPLTVSTLAMQTTQPAVSSAPLSNFSSTSAQTTSPKAVRAAPLMFSPMSSHTTNPQKAAPASLNMSTLLSHGTEPVALNTAKSAPLVLSISAIEQSNTEPKDEASLFSRAVQSERNASHMLTVSSHATEPRIVADPQLSMFSAASSQATQPLPLKHTAYELSMLSSHTTKPVRPRTPVSQVSALSSQYTEPVSMPRPLPRQISTLTSQSSHPVAPLKPAPSKLSMLSVQTTEPTARSSPAARQLSALSSQTTQPHSPRQTISQMSRIRTQHSEPMAAVVVVPRKHNLSTITVLRDVFPQSPAQPSVLPAGIIPRSVAKQDSTSAFAMSAVTSQNTQPSAFGDLQRSVPILAKTSSMSVQMDEPVGRNARKPLGDITGNAIEKTKPPTADGGTQTMVSAEQIDKLLLIRSQQRHSGSIATASGEKVSPPPISPKCNFGEMNQVPKRLGSSGSMRLREEPPPLPADHREVIAAAALKPVPATTPAVMGPPTMPASAYKKQQQTPSAKSNNAVPTFKSGSTTTRPRRHSQRTDVRSGTSSMTSRRSSLSSFTSELDHRFNIPGGPTFTAGTAPGTTDPHMIQAITQTMIGEYLWKYTRKTGRGQLSDNRHRRFFWIHPYTRTLYWSDRDPQSAGKAELKAKSVAIEAVQEVDDGNPLPPGLHHKSLLVITPGRTIKFTVATGQRHNTWFNALNYLCQRVEMSEEASQQQESKDATQDEIQDEFNGGYRSSSRATRRSRASMASYASRRNTSPSHSQVPTLRPGAAHQALHSSEQMQGSSSSRFSNILRPNASLRGSYSSRYSKNTIQEASTYEEPNSATMDLSRDIHEYLEDADGMQNVRACCDGKHDVGHLHTHSVKDRHSKGPSNRPSFTGSLSSRSQSRTESRIESRAESHQEARTDQPRHEKEVEATHFSSSC